MTYDQLDDAGHEEQHQANCHYRIRDDIDIAVDSLRGAALFDCLAQEDDDADEQNSVNDDVHDGFHVCVLNSSHVS